MKYIPILDQLIIKELPDRVKSKVMLPDGVAREITARATVLAAGPGFISDTGVRADMDVAEGDTILFNRDWPGRTTLEKCDDGDIYKIVVSEVVCKVQE